MSRAAVAAGPPPRSAEHKRRRATQSVFTEKKVPTRNVTVFGILHFIKGLTKQLKRNLSTSNTRGRSK